MTKPNNNDINFLTNTLKDYKEQLIKDYNTTIDAKALPYLAKKLSEEIKLKNNHRFFGTKEKNIIKIMLDNNILISSKTVPIDLYENYFDINTKNHQGENKQVLFIETKDHDYILSNNGLFEFEKNNNIYKYYIFNEEGEIENEMEVNHNKEILIRNNRKLNSKKVSNNLTNTKNKTTNPNEDSITSIQHPKNNCLKLLVVSTGIEGKNYGEKAANYIVKTLKDWFINLDAEILDIPNSLQTKLYETILKINYQLRKSRIKVGATLNCAIVTSNKTIIINIGSSKCYIIKDTNLKEITNDNSLTYSKEEEKIETNMNYKIDKGLGLEDSLSSYTSRPKLIDNDSYDKLLFITTGTNNYLSDSKIKFIANTPNRSKVLESIIDETFGNNQNIKTYSKILTKNN